MVIEIIWKTKKGMNSTLDIIKYRLSLTIGKSLLLGIELILFLFSLLIFIIDIQHSLLKELSSYVQFVLVISFLAIVYNISKFSIERYKKRHVYIKAIMESKICINELYPSEKEVQLGFVRVELNANGIDDVVFFSDRVNNFLLNNDLRIELSNYNRRHVRTMIKENYDVLIRFIDYKFYESIRNDKCFRNEKKLCLASDINIKSNNVLCNKGNYFDSVISNESYGRLLKSGENFNSIIANAVDLFPMEEVNGMKRLKDLSTSFTNNSIGVSTIAITSDNYLILWYQNRKAQQSAGLIAPTGSGSVDFKDLDTTEYSLITTICDAMERELSEESKINRKIISMSTHCLGFFRWGSRAGKPEFLGITKVDQDHLSLVANHKEISHRACAEFIKDVDSIPEIISNINKKNDLSIPLVMNLRFLGDLCANEEGKSILAKILE